MNFARRPTLITVSPGKSTANVKPAGATAIFAIETEAAAIVLPAMAFDRPREMVSTSGSSGTSFYNTSETGGVSCAAGILVVSLPGQGYALAPGFFLPPLSFALDEIAGLLVGADYVALSVDEGARWLRNRARL